MTMQNALPALCFAAPFTGPSSGPPSLGPEQSAPRALSLVGDGYPASGDPDLRDYGAGRGEATAALLERAAETTDPEERQRLIERVVVLNMGVARAVARRYRNRGVPDDDLEQVAHLALLRSARQFDPTLGTDLLSFAVPTIRGELRKYFRDHGWTVRPPRRIQELQTRIISIRSDLDQELGRSPRPSEVAQRLDAPIDDVLEALSADGCFSPASLDRPVSDDTTATLGDMLGSEDTAQNAAEARVVLQPLVQGLDERDRRILHLRFFEEQTQQQIADELGVTQVQVSRLLSRILARLRDQLTGDPA